MFVRFHSVLRHAGLHVGVGEWLALVAALDAGAVNPSLASFYTAARALVCRDEGDFDRFDQAFAACFEGVELPSPIRDEIEAWLRSPIQRPALSAEELEQIEKLSLDELRALFEQRLREQTERHDGGSRWIGTGGQSPFGQGGSHPTGMRVGEGAQGRGQAVAGARKRRFANYRSDRVLDTRSIAVAIRRLRRLERKGRRFELDIEETIRRTAAQAGELEIVERPERRNQARVVLLMDTGGSMSPHARVVESFFSAMKRSGGLRDVRPYYFHNCPYGLLFKDMAQLEEVPIEEVVRAATPSCHLVVVGDAWMGPYELFASYGSIEAVTADPTPGWERLVQLAAAFPRRVWLNPVPERWWSAETIVAARALFEMKAMTVDGIVEAVAALYRPGSANRRDLDVDSLRAQTDAGFR